MYLQYTPSRNELLCPKNKGDKFIYSEKATKFCKISTIGVSYVVTVKSLVEIAIITEL